jgi:hypothetical protein
MTRYAAVLVLALAAGCGDCKKGSQVTCTCSYTTGTITGSGSFNIATTCDTALDRQAAQTACESQYGYTATCNCGCP